MTLNSFFKNPAIYVGIAIFTMVFGAGNIIFPMSIGNIVGKNYFIAFLGIFLSSVLIPLAGFLACLNYKGSYEKFLISWIGKAPAIFVTALAMLILGPLGCIPRCATFAHAVLSWSIIPGISLDIFAIGFFLAVFLLCLKQNQLISVFGKFLGPLNLLFMAFLVFKGVTLASQDFCTGLDALQSFKYGFLESYKTFDLLAMIFYSNAIISGVVANLTQEGFNSFEALKLCRKGAMVAALIFSTIYFAFCFIAAKNACLIPNLNKEFLLSAYSEVILGSKFGALAGIIVLLACFSSACALTVVFAQYVASFGTRIGINYAWALICTTIFSLGFSKIGFTGIDNAVGPVTKIVYPFLILISLLGAIYPFLTKNGNPDFD